MQTKKPSYRILWQTSFKPIFRHIKRSKRKHTKKCLWISKELPDSALVKIPDLTRSMVISRSPWNQSFIILWKSCIFSSSLLFIRSIIIKKSVNNQFLHVYTVDRNVFCFCLFRVGLRWMLLCGFHEKDHERVCPNRR